MPPSEPTSSPALRAFVGELAKAGLIPRLAHYRGKQRKDLWSRQIKRIRNSEQKEMEARVAKRIKLLEEDVEWYIQQHSEYR